MFFLGFLGLSSCDHMGCLVLVLSLFAFLPPSASVHPSLAGSGGRNATEYRALCSDVRQSQGV